VIKMVCIVLCVFVICWSPLQVTILYGIFWHSSSEHGELPYWFEGFQYCSMILAYFNSALNPLLYGGLNDNFRQSFCNVLKCEYARRPKRTHFSQKSRTPMMSALVGNPSSGRINGVGSSKRTYEMRSISSRKESNICT
ncbi:uncharacterized protein TNCT_294811, partial [Trichonephila clavata]